MARYIDADVLSKAVIQSNNNNRHSDWILRRSHENEHRHFFSMIEAAPTADVAPIRRGTWIAVPSSDLSIGRAYKCSECKAMRYGSRLPPYCQECGSKNEPPEEAHHD